MPAGRARGRSGCAGLWRDDDAAARDGRVSIRSLQFPARVLVAWLAVLLAAIGVYGATAYDTTRRIAEFGLRIALGATPQSILRLAVSRSVALTVIGVGAGLAIALVGARLIGDAVYLVRGKHVGVVYQVSLSDPRRSRPSAGSSWDWRHSPRGCLREERRESTPLAALRE